MFVTLEATGHCMTCVSPLRWLMFATVRINKRSMRSTGTTLMACRDQTRRNGDGAAVCTMCAAEITHRPDDQAFRPTAEDAEKITAYRLRRWPELADTT